METLEALSERIDTTKDLQSIVRTMKSLSMVSIRQYERAAAALRQYSETVELGLEVVLKARRVARGETIEGGPVIAVVFGSDHGLCGRFNEQVADYARNTVKDLPGNGTVNWLTVGLRAASRLEAAGRQIDHVMFLPGTVGGLTATAQQVLLKIDEWRGGEQAVRTLVFHNRRTEDSASAPGMVQLLPVDPDWLHTLRERRWDSRSLPTFTMDPELLFSQLIRQHLFVTIYRAGAESMASEHATRLATMQAAERNIDEHLEEMNTEYRRRRQQSITEELLDVVAGFEALQSP
jgi:F-type H+-transporting ATPase subunit gamma